MDLKQEYKGILSTLFNQIPMSAKFDWIVREEAFKLAVNYKRKQ